MKSMNGLRATVVGSDNLVDFALKNIVGRVDLEHMEKKNIHMYLRYIDETPEHLNEKLQQKSILKVTIGQNKKEENIHISIKLSFFFCEQDAGKEYNLLNMIGFEVNSTQGSFNYTGDPTGLNKIINDVKAFKQAVEASVVDILSLFCVFEMLNVLSNYPDIYLKCQVNSPELLVKYKDFQIYSFNFLTEEELFFSKVFFANKGFVNKKRKPIKDAIKEHTNDRYIKYEDLKIIAFIPKKEIIWSEFKPINQESFNSIISLSHKRVFD